MHTEFSILDVGCGNIPRGDVNVDRFIGKTFHRWDRAPIRKHAIRNFVISDACKLPFRDKAFQLCISSHTLEHIYDYEEALKEFERVSVKVLVVVPFWRFGTFKAIHEQGHVHFFTAKTLKRLGYRTKINIRWVKPKILVKRFPLAIYPAFEVVAEKDVAKN